MPERCCFSSLFNVKTAGICFGYSSYRTCFTQSIFCRLARSQAESVISSTHSGHFVWEAGGISLKGKGCALSFALCKWRLFISHGQDGCQFFPSRRQSADIRAMREKSESQVCSSIRLCGFFMIFSSARGRESLTNLSARLPCLSQSSVTDGKILIRLRIKDWAIPVSRDSFFLRELSRESPSAQFYGWAGRLARMRVTPR